MTTHTFVQTSFACPEQYDVFNDSGDKVGYVRLRHGHLSTEGASGFARTFPLRGDEADLDARERILPHHDSDGTFDDDDIRRTYLSIISERISGDEAHHEVHGTFFDQYTVGLITRDVR